MTSSAAVAEEVRKRSSATITRTHIVQCIQRWNELYGEPPGTADWAPALARWRRQEWRIDRYRAGDPVSGAAWPSTNTVKRRFDGSFDEAVRTAGLTPRRPGPAATRSVEPEATIPVPPTSLLSAVGSPDSLAAAIRRVAESRASGQRGALDAALADVAREALRWRARL
ncbi:MAG: hypothetical protein JHC95_13510 [Solirubrobacteraceae bacterium]|nr:hypothetical protein [Solirubrobacteraceae bacterium]